MGLHLLLSNYLIPDDVEVIDGDILSLGVDLFYDLNIANNIINSFRLD
jgi:hypothetical protein